MNPELCSWPMNRLGKRVDRRMDRRFISMERAARQFGTPSPLPSDRQTDYGRSQELERKRLVAVAFSCTCTSLVHLNLPGRRGWYTLLDDSRTEITCPSREFMKTMRLTAALLGYDGGCA
jgi:hypothetical protein